IFLTIFITIIITLCLMYIGYFKPNLYLFIITDLYIYIILSISLSFFIYFFYFTPKKYILNISEILTPKKYILNISEIHYESKLRYLKYIIHKDDLLGNHDVLKPIFDTL